MDQGILKIYCIWTMDIKKILISQPKPLGRSPYADLEARYEVAVDFIPFVEIEGLTDHEFRQFDVDYTHYKAVIFTSKYAVDHYFRLGEETRMNTSEDTKFFCASDTVAMYMQKYREMRRRKILFGQNSVLELSEMIKKNKSRKFLIPCSEVHPEDICNLLEKLNITYSKVQQYRTVPAKLEDKNIKDYNIITFFAPSSVTGFLSNFPDYKKEDQIVAAFGTQTLQECKNRGIDVDIAAPLPGIPSMVMAIENYMRQKEQVTTL